MRAKTLTSIIAAIAVGGSLAACAPAPQQAQPTVTSTSISAEALFTSSAPETPTAAYTSTPVPTPTLGPLSASSNLFYQDCTPARPEEAFKLLDPHPIKGLEGTVVDSYMGLMSIVSPAEYSGVRPFTWLVLRDKTNEKMYLIYPGERKFNTGDRLRIGTYYELLDKSCMMNNDLVTITGMYAEDGENEPYFNVLSNFRIWSSAPDGHIDGIVVPLEVEPVIVGVDIPTPTPTATPEVKP